MCCTPDCTICMTVHLFKGRSSKLKLHLKLSKSLQQSWHKLPSPVTAGFAHTGFSQLHQNGQASPSSSVLMLSKPGLVCCLARPLCCAEEAYVWHS